MARRNEYLDIVKGVAIVMVVTAHCIQWGSGMDFYQKGQYFYEPLFKFIYSFHMPLFILVSGYLFYSSLARHTLANVAKSRFQSLLLPIISWQTLYLGIVHILIKGNSFSLGLIYSYSGCLWFLWSVIICSIIAMAGKVFFRDSLLFHIIVWIVLLFIPAHYLNGLHVFMYPYFMAGYFWNKHGISIKIAEKEISWKVKALLFLTIILFLFYFFYDVPEKSIYRNGTCLLGRESLLMQLYIDIMRYTYAFVGLSVVLILIDIIHEKYNIQPLRKSLISLGRNTLGIYVVNYYTTEYLLAIFPNSCPAYYALVLLETLGMILIAHTVSKMIQSNNILGFIFFGKSWQKD